MKKKVLITSISAVLFASVLVGGLFAVKAQPQKKVEATSDAVKPAPTYQTYVPLVDGWIEPTDGSAGKSVGDLLRARNDRFWNGNADPNNWDSQERTFNCTDEFIDTIHRAGGEGWRGNYRTPELTLVDNEHRYVSFMFGGGSGDIFANIYQITGEAGSGDRIAGIRTSFDGTGSFDVSKPDEEKLNAPISCNMVFKYFELPSEIQPGDKFLIFVRDGKESDYGGFTFGNVHINQTLEDVAKSFSVHKTQMKLNQYTSKWNENAINYVLNFYKNDSFYAGVRDAEALLTEANDDFEVNQHLSDWAYDTQFSSYGLDFNNVVSSDDAKAGFTERMPANKSGDKYFNGDITREQEGEKYRLVSSEFTLSGTGLISFKIGGGSAVVSLIDSNDSELVTSRINTAEGENILNPTFASNGGFGNIIADGSRFNTMSRMFIDASAHLGQKVRVRISDDRTGGNWGLAYFDEIVTKYSSLPSLKVDRIEQQFNDTPTYHGVVKDFYNGSSATTFGQAYAFMQTYYDVLRKPSNGQHYCSTYSSQDVKDLIEAYDGLNATIKGLVDGAMDYDFGSGATSENWYLSEVNLGNVADTMAYVSTLRGNSSSNLRVTLNESATTGTVLVVVMVLMSIVTAFYFVRRTSKNKNK